MPDHDLGHDLGHAEQALLGDADDPFEVPARLDADEIGFTFGVQHAPWMGTTWDAWNTFVAQSFNSLSNLGALAHITEQNGVNAPLYLTELGWAITDSHNASYYTAARPFSTMRGHTTLWYGPTDAPAWFNSADALCPGPTCWLDAPGWCQGGGGTVDCTIAGMWQPNPAMSAREHLLRRQVWNVVRSLRTGRGAGTPIQVDVANEQILSVFPWQNYGVYNRMPGESDPVYFARIAMPPTRQFSDIRPTDRLYYLDLALNVAHAADPRAKLFLNDYDLEVEGVGRKSAVLKEVARMLHARGTPLGGLGLQFHLKDSNFGGPYDHIGIWNPSYKATVQAYMAGLADVGVEAAVTEFNYMMPLGQANDDNVLRRHARAARDILDACVDSGNCSTFIAWGAIEDGSLSDPQIRGVVTHDLTPLPAYRALARGLARAVVPGAVVHEAEFLPTSSGATTSGGQAFRQSDNVDGYMFWTTGSLTAPVHIPVAGTYDYDVFGIGYPAAGVNPLVDMYLDTTKYGTLSMGSAYTHYKPEFVLPAGNHTAKLSFINDFQSGSVDRNAFIDAFVIRPKHRIGRGGCHSVQIKDLGVKDSTWTEFGWLVLFGNGGLRDAFSVTRSGWYQVNVLAYGFGATSNETVDLRVDGQTQTTWSLVNAPYGSAGTVNTVQVYLPRGTHEIGMWFTNDFTGGGQDRNVAFKQLDICPVLESSGSVAFSVTNTNSAQQNYTQIPIYLASNQVLTVGQCAGGSFTGDTYLRLANNAGVQQAANDDSCGLGSQIVFTAPNAGTYWLRMGCFSSGSCTGTTVWSIQP